MVDILMPSQLFTSIFAFLISFNGLASQIALVNADEPLDFARDIRPIFSNKCFVCHGPDANTREGGFRLDLKSSAMAEADSGSIPIVPGNTAKSELINRILHHDDDLKMPPTDSDFSLSEDEIKKIRAWVNSGANWSDHWAFVAPVKQELPQVKDVNWPANEIDVWVLSNLEDLGLQPTKSADRAKLIRRLSLDLTGLPPTVDEVDAFLNDDSEDAYEKVVDRLLASPAFGEHFASGWLDAARFADTNGYQNDFKRSMWVWRDWVIGAFNRNLPYDQFVLEQLAGDLVPDGNLEQVVATGFNRNHRTVTEGGSIEEEWHVENLVDRVETTSTVFLGLTMGCARCHDHKYDPISQREFYEFFAFFNSIDEKGFHNERRGNVPPLVKFPTEDYTKNISSVKATIDELENDLRGFERDADKKELSNRLATEVKPGRRENLAFYGTENSDSILDRSFTFVQKGHQPVELGNPIQFPREGPFSISCWVKPTSFGAILSKMDTQDNYRGFDILLNENGSLSVHLIHKWDQDAIKVTTRSKVSKKSWTNVVVTYSGNSKASGFNVYFDSELQKLQVNRDSLKSTTETEHPLWLGLRNGTAGFVGQIAAIKISDQELDQQKLRNEALAEIASAFARNADQEVLVPELIEHALLQTDPTYRKARQGLADAKTKLLELENNVPTVMVMKEANKPRPTYLLSRGQYDKPIKTEEIQPNFPAVLSVRNRSQARLNRMDLAKWLVHPKNPLTARVAVNRIWSQIFGVGIHKTVEDFGIQSPPPSNQSLLDFLAVDFMESGWDRKQLLKKILTSSTYRQDSSGTTKSFNEDPANLLLSRGSRYRLSAEAVRDNALAISGLLTRRVGGPSIKPYQPDGLWDELAGGAGEGKYVMDRDENLYRRSLYIYRKRTVPHPTMSTFDASSREVCQVSKQRTNTPLQALALLNDPTYIEAARHMAIKCTAAESGLDKQIELAFRSATARYPGQREIDVLKKAHQKALSFFEKDPAAVKSSLNVGVSQLPDTEATAELAALSTVCSMILNLDETITRD